MSTPRFGSRKSRNYWDGHYTRRSDGRSRVPTVRCYIFRLGGGYEISHVSTIALSLVEAKANIEQAYVRWYYAKDRFLTPATEYDHYARNSTGGPDIKYTKEYKHESQFAGFGTVDVNREDDYHAPKKEWHEEFLDKMNELRHQLDVRPPIIFGYGDCSCVQGVSG